MESWSRIPIQPGSTTARTGGSSLPAPGSVVMASVEEDMGEGMYALRWSGQRIAVFSQASLRIGQSLILKSEISAEGKPTLVVQGPALPEPGAITGRVVYGPGKKTGNATGQAEQERVDGRQSRQDAAGSPTQLAGGQVAAGVIRINASSLAPVPPVQSLIGLVLEPLSELEASVEALLESVAEEKERLEEKKEKEEKKAEQEKAVKSDDEGETGSETSGSALKKDRARPVIIRAGQAAAQPQTVRPPVPGEPPSVSTSAFSQGSSRSGGIAAAMVVESPTAAERSPSPAGNAQPPAAIHVVARDRPAVGYASPPTDAESPETPTLQEQTSKEQVPGDPTPGIKPEVVLKEALTQMVKASELPLGSPLADEQSLGVGGRMPEAIVDKAAGILLRAAGLTPDEATMEASRALVDSNVQVDRETVQAMMALAAGSEAEERAAILKAAARLSAKDIPLSPPLASGLADVMNRSAGPHELMDRARESLVAPADNSAAATLMEAAGELLDLLHVDLGRADAAMALERYVSTFGREALGRALALVEKSAQAVLENHPLLPKLDAALGAILASLEGEMVDYQESLAGLQIAQPAPAVRLPAVPPAGQAAPEPVLPPEVVLPPEIAPNQDEVLSESQPVPAPPVAPVRPLPAPMSPINAYINSPRAVPVRELLENLPPMPKLARLDQAVAQSGAPQVTAATQPGTPQLQGVPSQPRQPQSELPEPSPNIQTQPSGTHSAETAKLDQQVLNRLEALFQTPGLNRPELELLKPSGFLERFLNSAASGPDAEKIKSDAQTLLRQLTSDNPEHAARALAGAKEKSPAVLRETAARLTRMEAEALRSEPLLTRLSDAASSLRNLGRQLLAIKAENLAGQDRQPGVMLAEVPFKLNDDAGDGRMQMFYRRGKGKGDGWTSRVILDLNTTQLGPVLGDMRFFGQDMTVNMFVEKPEIAAFLEEEGGALLESLQGKGFRVKTRFMVMPPPPPVELRTERPQIAGEKLENAENTAEQRRHSTSARGRMDVKG